MALALVLGAVLGLILVAAPSARAYSGSATDPANIGSTEAFLEQGSPTRIPGVDFNDPRGADWWAQEHQYFDTAQPSSNDMWGELTALEEDTGMLPRIGAIAGDFTLAAGAAVVGYQIGTGLREMFHIGPGSGTTPTYAGACKVHIYGKGDLVYAGADVNTSIFMPFRGPLIFFGSEAHGCSATDTFKSSELNTPAPPWTITDAHARVGENSGSPYADYELGYDSTDALFNGNTDCSAYGPARPQQTLPAGDVVFVPQLDVTTFGACGSTPFATEATMFKPQPSDGDIQSGSCADVATDGASGCITAPTTWAGQPTTKTQLDSNVQTGCDHHPKACDAISALIDGGGLGELYPGSGTVTVPDCNGLLSNPCKALLQQDGFAVVVDRLDWQGADVSKPGDAWVGSDPGAGVEVQLPATVTITVNPETADMPLVIPARLPNEKAADYLTRVQTAGFPDAGITVLPDATYDPSYGPDEATAVSPQEGQRFDPHGAVPSPDITANPPTAPPVGSSGACGVPSVRSFDLSPLAVSVGTVFPFGVFVWVGDTISSWASNVSAPIWTFHLTQDLVWTVDLSSLEPAMAIVRPCFLVLSALGVVWMLAAAAMKIQGPSEE